MKTGYGLTTQKDRRKTDLIFFLILAITTYVLHATPDIIQRNVQYVGFRKLFDNYT